MKCFVIAEVPFNPDSDIGATVNEIIEIDIPEIEDAVMWKGKRIKTINNLNVSVRCQLPTLCYHFIHRVEMNALSQGEAIFKDTEREMN